MKRIIISLLVCITVIIAGNTVFAEDGIATEENSIKTKIEKYYDMAYDIYLNMEMEDMSSILSMESIRNQNFIVALEENIHTWEYSISKGYTVDYRKKHPLFYSFANIVVNDNTATVQVDIDGDRNEAYPPFVSFGKNTFTLEKVDGNWLIKEHDYTDILFEKSKTKKIKSDLKSLYKNIDTEMNYKNSNMDEAQYENPDNSHPYSYPYDDYYYSSNRAVAYANRFVSNRNTYFYDAGVDCTNYVSQCLAYGFGSGTSYSSPSSYRMVQGVWSAGSGGGFPAWESVPSHWDYMTRSKLNEEGPRVHVISWSSLNDGGVMQIDFDYDGRYDHTVICVSKAQQKFAQHTGNGYRYYNDYSGSKRYYRPSFFRKY